MYLLIRRISRRKKILKQVQDFMSSWKCSVAIKHVKNPQTLEEEIVNVNKAYKKAPSGKSKSQLYFTTLFTYNIIISQ